MTKRFFCALLISLFVVSPALLRALLLSWYDPAILSDWDEAYYFPLPFEMYHISWGSFLRRMDGRFEVYNLLNSSLPHAVSDIIVGKLAVLIGFSPAGLGIALDFICFLLSFLILLGMFEELLSSSLKAFAASLAMLLLPWLASLSSFIYWRAGLPERVTVVSHYFFPSQPVFRGIYTQLSYPLFLFVLSIFLRAFFRKEMSNRTAVGGGILAGLLVYLYFFAWIALTTLVFICIILQCLPVRGRESWLKPLGLAAIFAASSFFTAAYGLTALAGGGRLFKPGPADSLLNGLTFDYSRYYFFSPIMFVMLAGVTVVSIRLYRTGDHRRYVPALLVAAAIISEFLLMNLQPLLNAWITPYHFSLFYLHPVLGGTILALILGSLSASLSRAAAWIVIVAALVPSGVRLSENAAVYSEPLSGETQLLQEAADVSYSGKVFATMPFESPFDLSRPSPVYRLLPYWIKTLSRRESLSQFMSFDSDRERFVRKELFLGWLYSGRPGLLTGCYESERDIPMEDIMTGARAFHDFQRIVDCRLAARIKNDISECELLREFRTDYIIWESGFRFDPPGWLSDVSKVVWSDPRSVYRIIELNYAAAAEKICDDKRLQ